jgi:peptidoglycan/xylan/chitin deacetylase (PgdA/CDA1 family)
MNALWAGGAAMAELLVRHPSGYSAERSYILDVVLGEFLGMTFETVVEDRQDVLITSASDASAGELRLADVLFRTEPDSWLTAASLPRLPVPLWPVPPDFVAPERLSGGVLPVLYSAGNPEERFLQRSDRQISLDLDLLGSAFFLLSRYEENCPVERDAHGRFPASHSVLAASGMLERPVVNDYVEILRGSLQVLFPGVETRRYSYRPRVSHDVDKVFLTRDMGWWSVLRNSLGDVARRRDPALAAKRLVSRAYSGSGNYDYEPTNTFDYIMDCSDRKGIKSCFYWITEPGPRKFDPDYSLDMPWIREVIQRIAERGHEIGLHGSYSSHDRPDKIRDELARLMETAGELGVSQESWGSRQHYLCWDAGSTWRHLDAAGLRYDSTLGFPESAGFRCGVCYEYPVFDLLECRPLQLRERPLVAMDVSLLGGPYMGLDANEALNRIRGLSDQCRRFGGEFTLLWHNDKLVHARDRRLYEKVLNVICD